MYLCIYIYIYTYIHIHIYIDSTLHYPQKQPYEVSRMFLAALQLANSGNLEIDNTKFDAGNEGTCNMQLALLSNKSVC